MNIINLTPHAITIGDRTIQPSGIVARVATVSTQVEVLDGIPVVITTWGEPQGIPNRVADTIYLVSAIVLNAAKGRPDVLAPDTGPESVIRDADGKIVGVRRLVRAAAAE